MMKRVHRTLITSAVILTAGLVFAVAALRERELEPDRIRKEKTEKRLFIFGAKQVVSGVMRAKGAEIHFKRVGPNNWQLLQPLSLPGDAEAINAALTQMSGINADALVTENVTPEDLETYGLNSSKTSMEVTLEDGRKHTLIVGAKNEMELGYYVTTGEQARIVLAAEAFHWALDRELFAFRKKQVFDVERNKLTRIEVVKGTERLYALEKDGQRWKLGREKLDLTGDPAIINRFLVILTRDLKAESIVTDETPLHDPAFLGKYGLAAPAFTVTITTEDGRTLSAQVGTAPAEDPKEEPLAYALLDGTKTVVEVYRAFPHDLDQELSDLRDRTIARFDPSAVARMELLLMNGKKVVVKRGGAEGEWQITAPLSKPAKSWKIDAVLTRFSRLRSKKIHAEEASPAQLREWLIDPPEQRASFFDQSDQPLADVRIGKYLDGQSVFVARGGSKRVDLVPGPRLDVLPKLLEDLVDSGS
jgi:hypothetical protein